jgi:hypothetical protein
VIFVSVIKFTSGVANETDILTFYVLRVESGAKKKGAKHKALRLSFKIW